MAMSGQEVLATPISYNQGRNGNGPALHVKNNMPLYAALRLEFDYLRDCNSGAPPAERGSPAGDARRIDGDRTALIG